MRYYQQHIQNARLGVCAPQVHFLQKVQKHKPLRRLNAILEVMQLNKRLEIKFSCYLVKNT